MCACVCVLCEAQFSCLAWCADGRVGASRRRYPFYSFCFFICPCFLSYSLVSSPHQVFLLGFIYQFTSLAASSLSSLHLLRAILGRGEFSARYLSLLLYAPLRAQCSSYTWWLWNEMSLNRAMCPGATVIAGEIQLPL